MYNFEGIKLQTQIIKPYRKPYWRKKILRKPHKLLYFHGFAEGYIAKLDYLQALAHKGWKVYTLNLPGHGTSEMPEELSWEWLAQLYEDFIATNKLENACWLGYSLGGGIIQKLLARKEYLPKRNVLVAPYVPTSINSADGISIAEGFRKHVQEISGTLHFNEYKQGSGLLWQYKDLFAAPPAEGQTDFPETTIIMLDDDPVFPPKLIRKYFEGDENIQLQLLRGFSHDLDNLPIEYKQVLIQHILQALS